MTSFGEISEPFFDTVHEAEDYLTKELRAAFPRGWSVEKRPEDELIWRIARTEFPAGEWSSQDYWIFVPQSLEHLVFTYGNNDIGPGGIHNDMQKALVLDTRSLRYYSLAKCVAYLLETCRPNEWGYT